MLPGKGDVGQQEEALLEDEAGVVVSGIHDGGEVKNEPEVLKCPQPNLRLFILAATALRGKPAAQKTGPPVAGAKQPTYIELNRGDIHAELTSLFLLAVQPRQSRKRPMTPEPEAYGLARKQEPALREWYRSFETEMQQAGRLQCLSKFLYHVRCGRAAVNMSVYACWQFFKKKKLLNAYELAVRRSLKAGETRDADTILREEILQERYEPRRHIDELLKLGPHAHYGYLNVGGVGPTDKYGVCCVLLEEREPFPYATCFAGDSMTKTFKKKGKEPLRRNAEIFSRFATRKCLPQLATKANSLKLKRAANGVDGVDGSWVRQRLEARETLVEVHLLGLVTCYDAWKVLIKKDKAETFLELAEELRQEPEMQELEIYDDARYFPSLLMLLDDISAERQTQLLRIVK